LRKPSLAAWVVNLLVRRDADQVTQVLDLGAALREAAAGMQGEELRALTRQRRQLTAAVTTGARALASGEGVKVTQAVADQVEATLTAAMVDARCADAVRSGMLVTALAATGVDDVDLGSAVATPDALGFAATTTERPPPDLHVVPDPDADEKAIAAAREAVADAQRVVDEARQAATEAATAVAELEARALQLQSEADELKRKLAAIEDEQEELDDDLSDAESERSEADAAVAESERELAAATASLEKLGG
jgi:hypothetical protein